MRHNRPLQADANWPNGPGDPFLTRLAHARRAACHSLALEPFNDFRSLDIHCFQALAVAASSAPVGPFNSGDMPSAQR